MCLCSGDANQRLILVQKNGREDKNGFPEEFETVEGEKLKQKERWANHLHCNPSDKEKRANPGHPATDALTPQLTGRGGAGGVLISNNRLNQQMLRPSCEFAANKLGPPGGLECDSPSDLPVE